MYNQLIVSIMEYMYCVHIVFVYKPKFLRKSEHLRKTKQ